MDIEIKIEADYVQKLSDQIESLVGKEVFIGIPADAEERPGEISNAALGYLFETGSPATNMPARPWLAPGVMESRQQWMPYLNAAASAAVQISLTGSDERAVDNNLQKAAQAAVSGIKRRVRSKLPPPLKPATIAARWRRHQSRRAGRPMKGETRISAARRAAGRMVMVGGKPVLMDSDVTPLIDEGNWINSISYTITKKFTNK